MKFGIPALMLAAGLFVLPGATVVPCIEAAAQEDQAAAVAPATEGEEAVAALPVCDATAGTAPQATKFLLPAGGGVAALLVALGAGTQNGAVTTTTTTN